MKRLLKPLTLAALVLLIPSGLIFGQEKQIERKIKIVITDEKGALL